MFVRQNLGDRPPRARLCCGRWLSSSGGALCGCRDNPAPALEERKLGMQEATADRAGDSGPCRILRWALIDRSRCSRRAPPAMDLCVGTPAERPRGRRGQGQGHCDARYAGATACLSPNRRTERRRRREVGGDSRNNRSWCHLCSPSTWVSGQRNLLCVAWACRSITWASGECCAPAPRQMRTSA